MLSFGIELSRAFWMAAASVALASGSAPPSRAATMIARESLEKSWPRLASCAPFLCLIDDHLLCPDTGLLPHELEEALVNARVIGQLRVEGRDQEAPLAEQDRFAVQLGEHFYPWACLGDARRPDKDSAQRLILAGELDVGFKARHLSSVGVSAHDHVDEAEVVTVEEDHARARAEDRAGEAANRLLQAVNAKQPPDRRRLAARNDQAVEALELLDFSHLHRLCAEAAQDSRVLAEVALDGENPDFQVLGRHLPTLPPGPPAPRPRLERTRKSVAGGARN